MKIEIHIRDTDKTGKRVGKRNAFLESCRVFKEAGDGLRLDNLAPAAYVHFKNAAKSILDAWKNNAEANVKIRK